MLSTPAKRQKSHLTVWAQRTGAVCLQACWGEDWAGRRSGAGSCLHVQLSRARLVDARRAQHVEVIRLAGSLPPNRRIKSGAAGRDVHASDRSLDGGMASGDGHAAHATELEKSGCKPAGAALQIALRLGATVEVLRRWRSPPTAGHLKGLCSVGGDPRPGRTQSSSRASGSSHKTKGAV